VVDRLRPPALLLWLLPPLIALAVALPAVSGPFVLDDALSVAGHPIVTGKAPLSEIACYNHLGQPLPRCRAVKDVKAPAVGPTWRPLSTLFFALQWAAFDGSPILLRVVSALGYALLCLLVMLLARHLGLTPTPACLAATLFAALAIHVDALALANSAESWALALQVLALLAVLAGRPLAAAAIFLAALGFKESAIVLPAIVAWIAPWRRLPRLRLTVLACGGVALGFLLLRSQIVPLGVAGWTSAADNPLLSQPLLSRWGSSIALLGRYLALTVAPHGLAVDYSYAAILPAEGISAVYLALGVVAIGGLATALLVAWRRRSEQPGWALVGLCAGAFAISFALPSNALVLLPIIFAERLFFAASLWLLLGASALAVVLAARRPRLGVALAVVAGLAILAQAAIAVQRSALWADPLALLAAQVEQRPESVKGQLYFARRLAAAGEPARALWHLALAMQGRGRFPAPWRPPALAPRAGVGPDYWLSRIPALLAPRAPPAEVWRRLAVSARRLLGARAARLASARARQAAQRL